MQQESSQLTTQLNNLINDHRESEEQLRRVCIALEEISNLEHPFCSFNSLIITLYLLL